MSSLSSTSDNQLIESIAKQDQRAYKELYKRHYRRVELHCRSTLFNKDQASEAAQETFLRVFLQAANYTPRASVLSWMMKIARNHCIDLNRRAQLRSCLSLDAPVRGDDDLTTFVEITPSDDASALQGLLVVEFLQLLSDSVCVLTANQKEAFDAAYVAGLPGRDAAASCGVSESAYKSRLYNATQRVRSVVRTTHEQIPEQLLSYL